jgi:hypothetical protein
MTTPQFTYDTLRHNHDALLVELPVTAKMDVLVNEDELGINCR